MRQARAQLLAASCLIIGAIVMQAAHAVPLPGNNQELDLLQIPLANGKEIDVLTLGAKDQEQLIADRNKRTIGLLRELFPDITKEIDSIVNRIIAQVIRVAGPSVISGILNTNRGGSGGTTSNASFDASFDDDDDDDNDDDDDDFNFDNNDKDNNNNSNNDNNANNRIDLRNRNNFVADNDVVKNGNGENVRVQIDLPTFAPDGNTNVTPTTASTTSATTTTTTVENVTNKR